MRRCELLRPLPASNPETWTNRPALPSAQIGTFLHSLHQRPRAESATAAHRNDRSSSLCPLKLVDCLGDECTARRTQGMPQRDRTTVRIYPAHIGPEHARPAEDY